MMPIPAIEFRDISFGYNRTVLFEHVSLTVNDGGILAVLGLNGSGKSTLVRSICRLQKLLSGSILLQGKNIADLDAHAMAKIVSVVLSGRGHVQSMLSVEEMLRIARSPYTDKLHRLKQRDDELIHDIVSQLGLTALLQKKIYTLSDGEAQKVLIARALVQETPVILLDEPTSHLDMHNKAEIFSLLKTLSREQHKTIIFTSHELELSLRTADSCLLLQSGGRFTHGSTETLLEKGIIPEFFPSNHYTFNWLTNRFDIVL